jgi:nucleoside-diphosphate-sugar epimerase
MENFTDFKPEDPLHITSFSSTTIKEVAAIIQGQFNAIGMYDVKIKPGIGKDSVQMDKRNEADTFITQWWLPKTSIDDGIAKVFNEMKKDYVND